MLLKITYFEKEERVQALGICIYIYIFFFLFFEIVELLNAPRTCILSVIVSDLILGKIYSSLNINITIGSISLWIVTDFILQ